MSRSPLTESSAQSRGKHVFSIDQTIFPQLRARCSGDGDDLLSVLSATLTVLLLRHFSSDEISFDVLNGKAPAQLRMSLPDNPAFSDLVTRASARLKSEASTDAVPAHVLLVLSGSAKDFTNYDVVFTFTESDGKLEGTCEYNPAHFGETTIASLTRHFMTLLRKALAQPNVPISQLQMLDSAELHRILVEWNRGDVGYSPFCIHELIEQQVERTPDALAVNFSDAKSADTKLTYRELNTRSNQLAHYLRVRGAGPEIPVGILMEASAEMVIAVLAILKSGGAYVSLDCSQPPNRLREMIREAALTLAVTTTSNPAYQAIADEMEFLCLDTAAARISEEPASNPRSGVTPENMALARYTSGSTGKPKGAVSIHRSITSRLMESPLPDFVPSDVCLVNTSFGFGTKLFFPLTMGATVVVIPENQVRDISRLADTLERFSVTTLMMVPTQLRQLLGLGEELTRRLPRMRNITTGGELLTVDLAARFRELLPHAQLLNTYGSSEVGGCATTQLLDADALANGNSIGRPVANTRVYLLDRDLHPVPPGVTGEIYVGSGHMGRGYLNRPDLTEPRFVADPFGTSNSGVLYRTGDLGRYFDDGRIEFLGRADRQIKLRGYRVELEEIEAALHDHSQICQAAVTTQRAGTGLRLIAYVVPHAGQQPDVSALQKFLRERKPEYMLPHAFVFLDRMPLNRAGKVDMLSLPLPGTQRPAVATVYEAPRNPMEEAIAGIWSGVLRVEHIGIHDNFIELGGDSLHATAVSARLLRHMQLDVPMELILEWSIATIAREMMAEADQLRRDSAPA